MYTHTYKLAHVWIYILNIHWLSGRKSRDIKLRNIWFKKNSKWPVFLMSSLCGPCTYTLKLASLSVPRRFDWCQGSLTHTCEHVAILGSPPAVQTVWKVFIKAHVGCDAHCQDHCGLTEITSVSENVISARDVSQQDSSTSIWACRHPSNFGEGGVWFLTVVMRFPQWIWRSCLHFWTGPSPKRTLWKEEAHFFVPSVIGGWKGGARWLNISNPVFHLCNFPYLECGEWCKRTVNIWHRCLKMLSTYLWKSKLLEKIFQMLGKPPPTPKCHRAHQSW